MKKNIKQHFATTYRRLTKKIMAFIYWSTFLVHFTMLAPLHGFWYGINGMFHDCLDYSQKPPLGSRFNTISRDHGTTNAHNRWFILFYHVWGHAWINIHWNSIWLTAQSHMASRYTWRFVTTLHDFGGVLGRPLDTFLWALTISWSRLLVRVWSGPNTNPNFNLSWPFGNQTNSFQLEHMRFFLVFSWFSIAIQNVDFDWCSNPL